MFYLNISKHKTENYCSSTQPNGLELFRFITTHDNTIAVKGE